MKKVLVAAVLFLTVGLNDLLAQCAMCRATIENNVSHGETTIGSGLNLGILYLFVTPYLLIGLLAYLWYKKSSKHARKISRVRYSES
ncbi:MAG: hypothetical protein ACLFUB_04350 [Cyclobacteriaceae bacterium]